MFSSKLIKHALFSSLLLATACNPYNSYVSPPICCPQEWKAETEEASPPCVDEWWEVFNDPQLNCLEEQAVANNRDIQLAFYRLKEASAYSRLALSQLFPQITFDPSYSKLDQLTNFGVLPDAGTFRLRQRQYTLPIDAFVPFDIWNENGLNYESAVETAQASCYAWQWVILSITAEVANNYYALRTLDSELAVIEESIAIRQNQLEITSARYNAGIVNYTDVSRASTELTNAKAEFEDILRSRTKIENALATLTGQFASCFVLPDNPLAGPIPPIPSGVPCNIINRRADIHEAERLVAAAHDQIGVSWAAFFPSVSLTGSIGYSSPNYTDLLTWRSRFWSYMYNVSQVLFDGGALIADYQISYAVYYQAMTEYYRRILIAFQQVEDALVEIELRATQEAELLQSVDSAITTLSIVQIRYEEGLIDYLDVVDAERTLLETQRSEVRSHGAQYIATSQLIKALGGGWDYVRY